MRTVALFDLDGTLTDRDTMLAFLAFMHGRGRMYRMVASVLPELVLSKLGWIADDRPKQAIVRKAFAGQPVATLREAAVRFNKACMPTLVRPGALERIREHRARGHQVIVVTASCALWVAPWCKQHELELIATELEVAGDSFTGRLATPNCKGAEKVARIQAYLGDLQGVKLIAYGDTASDRPMLALANEQHYKPFR